jgi:hypothetical protein
MKNEMAMMKKKGRGMAKAAMQKKATPMGMGMGMKKGGKVHEDVKKDKPMMEKVAKKAVKGHEARMHGSKKMMGGGMAYKSGGGVDGCATKGKTKGKMVKMAYGGKTC